MTRMLPNVVHALMLCSQATEVQACNEALIVRNKSIAQCLTAPRAASYTRVATLMQS